MTLIEHLIQQLDISRQQAEGGAAILLEVAHERLTPDDFQCVMAAIPAISDVIAKAPRQVGPPLGLFRLMWQRWFSGWGMLASARLQCEQLRIDRELLDRFIESIGDYFRELGKPEVETILWQAWR